MCEVCRRLSRRRGLRLRWSEDARGQRRLSSTQVILLPPPRTNGVCWLVVLAAELRLAGLAVALAAELARPAVTRAAGHTAASLKAPVVVGARPGVQQERARPGSAKQGAAQEDVAEVEPARADAAGAGAGGAAAAAADAAVAGHFAALLKSATRPWLLCRRMFHLRSAAL